MTAFSEYRSCVPQEARRTLALNLWASVLMLTVCHGSLVLAQTPTHAIATVLIGFVHTCRPDQRAVLETLMGDPATSAAARTVAGSLLRNYEATPSTRPTVRLDVDDVYFDDETWVVRYLVVERISVLLGRRGLVGHGRVSGIATVDASR